MFYKNKWYDISIGVLNKQSKIIIFEETLSLWLPAMAMVVGDMLDTTAFTFGVDVKEVRCERIGCVMME